MSDSISCLRIPWKNITVKETKNHYFLYYNPLAGFIIPKRNMLRWASDMINNYIIRFALKRNMMFRK